jgi:hypothetical protein
LLEVERENEKNLVNIKDLGETIKRPSSRVLILKIERRGIKEAYVNHLT